jgi:myosin V
LYDRALEEEVVETLIMNLRVPLPSTQSIATHKEIFFPAHLIGNVVILMISNEFFTKLQNFLIAVMRAIRTVASVRSDLPLAY